MHIYLNILKIVDNFSLKNSNRQWDCLDECNRLKEGTTILTLGIIDDDYSLREDSAYNILLWFFFF